VPEGESPSDVAARADAVLERAAACDGDVCLVAHGHVLRMVTVRWLEQEPGFGARLPLEPAHLAVLDVQRETRVLRAWGASA